MAASGSAAGGAFDPLDTSDRASLTDRQVAERFIEAFHRQCRMREAFMAWVHPDYIQHNPEAPAGRDETLDVLDEIHGIYPRMSHDVKRVIHGDDGLVAIHHNWRAEPEDLGAAVVDILRIENGWVVEHWDVIQRIPDPSTWKNTNTMF